MSGFVYFMQCGNFIKIGYSKKPDERRRCLSHGPYDVRLISFFAGTLADETALHRRFVHLRCEGKKDWFSIDDELMSVANDGFEAMRRNERTNPFIEAIAIFGSEGALARATDLTATAINRAKKTGRIGTLMAHRIDKATGGRINRHMLRPDIYPPENGSSS